MDEQPTLKMNESFDSLSVVKLSYHGKSHYNCILDKGIPLGDGSKDTLQIRNERLRASKQYSLGLEEEKNPLNLSGSFGNFSFILRKRTGL
jgi:hypothetical protein